MLFGQPVAQGELLPWSWARERLDRARDFWIATTRPDGSPHTRPVWGVWLDSGFWFSTGSSAARNLAKNPEISVHPAAADEVVVVEGAASVDVSPEALAAYNAKYSWTFEPDGDGVRDGDGTVGSAFLVRPRVVLGWEADLRTPTRWPFHVA
ncbi:pyridoxamine 5'-phosphate oxidase family protein [Umezawaea tangerina]|uniref:Pyridoxamine 5'-phosphate oxidase n=1 Tax=Umezawaea tangerina TaxID=84725 RepID=A0A2T0T3T1_9PSEU|nr:pyridoxamine 5'-phosphate oxidase family protein [Umezawaea tangerina]PRY40283.1 pyridoxamine 5'-phosphate oxidase [Umezawaea tangerina]